MSRFNAAVKVQPDTVNLAGGVAYTRNPESRLVSLLLGSFLRDQFYRSGDDTLDELVQLVGLVDPTFAARAALYARDEFGMRSVSHVVAAELCDSVKDSYWLRPFLSHVVIRPDDVTEILSYWLGKYGKPIPNAMKRGLGDALSGFDAYRLGKYKAEGKKLSLIDAVNLCHPKHTEALAALMDGTLEAPDTWEVELTRAGHADDKAVAKGEVWRRLLAERKLGYFALLRNLRNIIEQSPESVPMAAAQLTDETAVRKSRVLPFRFLTAWDTVGGQHRDIDIALSIATDHAVANVPTLPGKTLIAVDGSGSMQGGFCERRGPAPISIASLFAAALLRRGDADVMIFDTGVQWPKLNPLAPVMTNADLIKREAKAGGTDFQIIFEHSTKPYDRIIILSDMQAWVTHTTGWHYAARHTSDPATAAKDYRARTACDPFIWCFDLQGYGTAQFPEKKVGQLCGWSDKAFDYMLVSERGDDALVKAVREVAL